MTITVTQTKIIKPNRRADLVSRQRLLEIMADLLDYRLTLVTAPAGYGKTTLLVDLADQMEVPFCWFSLDPLDQDLYRFLVHFIAAVKRHFPGFGENSLALIRNLGQQEDDLNRLVRTIVNDAYENIQEHFIFVLDDYHLIDKNPQINRFISQFGQDVDENCHLVIASRTLLDLPDLPLMVGRSQVKGLSFEELAFQPQEIQQLMSENYQRDISRQEALALAGETEGWITGLLLTAETSAGVPKKRSRLVRASGVDLYDYLAEQVLEQQPRPIRNFMLKTSLLEEFNASLCQDVLGEPPAGTTFTELINTILQKNLFVIPVANQGTWIRYHHLYRDFLQARFKQERPAEEQQLLRILVNYHLEKKHWEKAYQYGIRLGDQRKLAELIELSGGELMKDGRMKLLRSWIDDLPDPVLANHPNLLSRYGAVAAVLGSPQLGLTYLEQAHELLSPDQEPFSLAKNLVWQASAHRFLGNHQASLDRSLRALQLTRSEPGHLPVRAQASKAAGLAHYRMGRTSQALQMLQDSIAAYSDLADHKDAALVTMDLGLVYMQTGQFTKAAGLFQQALETWLKTNNITHQANLYNNLGVLHHHTGRYREAYEHFQKAMECARQSGYVRMEAYALTSLGDLYRDLDAPQEAQVTYQKAFQLADEIEDHFLIRYLEIMDARIYRTLGELHRAHLILSSLEADLAENGTEQELGIWYLEKGLVELEDGQYDRAAQRFETAIDLLGTEGPHIDSIKALFYRAYALHLGGQSDHANKVLNLAYQQTANLETVHALIPTVRKISPLLQETRSSHPLSFTLDRLLELRSDFEQEIQEVLADLTPQDPSSEEINYHLRVSALGRPQVSLHGQPVKTSEWVNQKSARDLFYYLLASERGKRKSEIGSDLWPDNPPDTHQRKFKNAVYRLRRALGKNIVLYDSGSRLYRINRDLSIWYDVDQFQAAVQAGLEAEDPDIREKKLAQAVSLYSHPYLAGRHAIWVETIRTDLTLKFQKAALNLAEHHLDTSPDRTLELCQQLLDIDPCQEEAHRLSMRVHAARGDRSAVARQYRLCQESFARLLQTEPSQSTTDLYQSLVS
jgi:ATP/maltotriose-dependent transcriptional regulator MalT/DNA-binding SARP family transcriptional activator